MATLHLVSVSCSYVLHTLFVNCCSSTLCIYARIKTRLLQPCGIFGIEMITTLFLAMYTRYMRTIARHLVSSVAVQAAFLHHSVQ